MLDGRTLAFADFAGNKQFVTMGNISVNDKVTLFLMDYPHRTRLKILGHAAFEELENDPALAQQLLTPEYKARPERIVRIKVAGFDWNCPQHITPRYTEEDILEQLRVSAGQRNLARNAGETG